MPMFVRYHFLSIVLLISCVWGCTSPDGNDTDNSNEITSNTADEEVSDYRFEKRRGEMTDKIASYEASDRKNWQKPEFVIDRLSLADDMTVVEIGAGSGYFSFRLLPEVKKVIATDIDTNMIAFMEENRSLLPPEFRDRLETRLVEPSDPGIEEEVDLVFLVNTYAYIPNRIQYFSKVRDLLKARGKVVIVDFKMRDIPVGPPPENKVPLFKVEKEMKEAGFSRFSSDDRSLPYQYIYIGWP